MDQNNYNQNQYNRNQYGQGQNQQYGQQQQYARPQQQQYAQPQQQNARPQQQQYAQPRPQYGQPQQQYARPQQQQYAQPRQQNARPQQYGQPQQQYARPQQQQYAQPRQQYAQPQQQYARPQQQYAQPRPQYGHNQYGRQGNRPAVQLSTNFSLAKMFWLGLITCGIYEIVMLSKMSVYINTIASRYDGRKTMHFCLVTFVFSWLTFGILPIVWFHKLSSRMGAELRRRGINYNFSAKHFWLWEILGSIIICGPFIYTHKLCTAMNLLAGDYNARG